MDASVETTCILLSGQALTVVEAVGRATFDLHNLAAVDDNLRQSQQSELETGQSTPLEGMRVWLQADTGRIARGKVSAGYQAAKAAIERIHQAHTLADPENPLPPHAPSRLLANFVRYYQTCDDADPSNLTHKFLAGMYTTYVNDVKLFQNYGVSKPEDVALYHSPQILASLEAQYEDHAFIGRGDINKAFIRNRRDPPAALDALTSTVIRFKEVIEPMLREEYGYLGDWSLQFVKNICEASDPESVARKVFTTMQAIQAEYPRANLKTVARWAEDSAIEAGKKTAKITELLREVPNVTVNEETLSQSEACLTLIRESLLSGRISPQINGGNMVAVQQLLRIIDTNWHTAFDTIDVSREVRRLCFAVRRHNETLDPQEVAIDTAPENLYNMLVVFASQVAVLQEEGPVWAASDVARYHAPGIYNAYQDKYKDEASLSSGTIAEIISHFPMSIDRHIAERIDRISDLRAEFGSALSAHCLRQFSQYPDGADRTRAYLDFAPKAKAARSWIADADVARCFYSSSTPEIDFERWATTVEEIRSRFPRDRRFSIALCKRMTRYKMDADDTINGYLDRLKEIRTTYKGNPFIPEEFAAHWAAGSPKAYLDIAKAHLRRIDRVNELLDAADEEVDYVAARYLAFSDNSPEKRVAKYLELKHALEVEYSEDDYVEQWMINQVAAHSNRFVNAEYKLRWLRYMKRVGIFDISLDKSTDYIPSYHEVLADKAWHSLPENVVIYLESYAERQAQVEAFLSGLNPLDRQAVEVVFGFAPGDRAALEEELNIEDLEAYVVNEVVPHIQARSRADRLS